MSLMHIYNGRWWKLIVNLLSVLGLDILRRKKKKLVFANALFLKGELSGDKLVLNLLGRLLTKEGQQEAFRIIGLRKWSFGHLNKGGIRR